MSPTSIFFSILVAACVLGISLLQPRLTPPSGRIDGLAVDEARRPLRDVIILIESTTATGPVADIAPITNDQGRFSLPNLPPGRYTLRAGIDGYKTQRQTVEVESGKSTAVEFVMPKAG